MKGWVKDKFGFKDNEELFNMIAKIDLSDFSNLSAFNAWKQNDGTKTGL